MGSAACRPARNAINARCLTRRLLTLYAEYRVTPPPGLWEFAERIGNIGAMEL
jgi:hypothetical protein